MQIKSRRTTLQIVDKFTLECFSEYSTSDVIFFSEANFPLTTQFSVEWKGRNRKTS